MHLVPAHTLVAGASCRQVGQGPFSGVADAVQGVCGDVVGAAGRHRCWMGARGYRLCCRDLPLGVDLPLCWGCWPAWDGLCHGAE